MPKQNGKPVDVDSISQGRLDAYKRTTRLQDAKTSMQIALMYLFVITIVGLIILTFAVGVFQGFYFLDTEGTRALAKLFTEIVGNTKTLALIALGYFFREYMDGNKTGGS